MTTRIMEAIMEFFLRIWERFFPKQIAYECSEIIDGSAPKSHDLKSGAAKPGTKPSVKLLTGNDSKPVTDGRGWLLPCDPSPSPNGRSDPVHDPG